MHQAGFLWWYVIITHFIWVPKNYPKTKTYLGYLVCTIILLMVMFDTNSEITVPKLFGDWTNEGTCIATGKDSYSTCGPGTQHQKRTCTEGTVEKCTDADKVRTGRCEDYGTGLPSCLGT